jgi:hypothetical protein
MQLSPTRTLLLDLLLKPLRETFSAASDAKTDDFGSHAVARRNATTWRESHGGSES